MLDKSMQPPTVEKETKLNISSTTEQQMDESEINFVQNPFLKYKCKQYTRFFRSDNAH